LDGGKVNPNFLASQDRMQKPCSCTICQSPEHSSSKCPELVKELETGFYTPAGGMPQGGDDDDESSEKQQNLNNLWIQMKARWDATLSLTLALNTSSPLLHNPLKTC
jgi:hypothetical protein